MAKRWNAIKPTRRLLLKVMGAASMAGFISTPLVERLLGSEEIAFAHANQQGERYQGFLLLPEGTPLPAGVTPSVSGVPVMCGVNGQKTTAVSRHFETLSSFKKRLGALAFYVPTHLPQGTQAGSGFTIEHQWGNIFAATVSFRGPASAEESSQPVATLWAEPDIPRPFPFFYGQAHDPYAVVAEKVNFLPTPGLMVRNQQIKQTTFYWIQQRTYYRLTVHDITTSEARAIASSLKLL